jgi:hypothetical protein
VNGACAQLLTCSGVTDDKYRRVAGSHARYFFDGGQERRCAADELLRRNIRKYSLYFLSNRLFGIFPCTSRESVHQTIHSQTQISQVQRRRKEVVNFRTARRAQLARTGFTEVNHHRHIAAAAVRSDQLNQLRGFIVSNSNQEQLSVRAG